MTGFRILGPVEAWAGEQVIDAGQPRQRHVLAALLVDAGRSVTWERLIDRVWGQQPPGGARNALRAHVSRIRRVLEQVGRANAVPVGLVRRGGGYGLEVDPDLVDLHRLRRLAGQARRPGRAPADRAVLLRQAAQLWRGEPLAGLTGDWPARVRQAWRQEYLDIVVMWADAELLAGNAGDTIRPLTELAGEYPLGERLTAGLMRALAAAGRPAEALEQYARVRRHLAEELGTDPGTEMQVVYHAVLQGEQNPSGLTADRAVAITPATVTEPVVPAQLPADTPGFTGRSDYLACLDALHTPPGAQPRTAMGISAVSGAPGVGKTALAVHWAHRVRDRFPDGQLYVNLRGFDPSGQIMPPGEALRGFLHALGVGSAGMPDSLDAQVALYRSLLAGKRVLVVLDNARDAQQARPLLPASPTAAAVVTSRSQLAPLIAADGACPLTLDVLSAAEARDVLTVRLGTHQVAAEPQAVGRIIMACGGLPIALTVAATRAQLGLPLGALAAELAGTGERLAALDAGDPASDVRAVFSWSVNALTPPAARLFRLLGLHPGPDVSAPAAAGLIGLPAPETRRLLTELTRASLLTEHTDGTYSLHRLLRAYAAALAHAHDAGAAHRAATTRPPDHDAHTAHAATWLLDQRQMPAEAGTTAGTMVVARRCG